MTRLSGCVCPEPVGAGDHPLKRCPWSDRYLPVRVAAMQDLRRSGAAGAHTSRRPRGAVKRAAIRDQEN